MSMRELVQSYTRRALREAWHAHADRLVRQELDIREAGSLQPLLWACHDDEVYLRCGARRQPVRST